MITDIYLKEVTDKLNFKEGILQPALGMNSTNVAYIVIDINIYTHI